MGPIHAKWDWIVMRLVPALSLVAKRKVDGASNNTDSHKHRKDLIRFSVVSIMCLEYTAPSCDV